MALGIGSTPALLWRLRVLAYRTWAVSPVKFRSVSVFIVSASRWERCGVLLLSPAEESVEGSGLIPTSLALMGFEIMNASCSATRRDLFAACIAACSIRHHLRRDLAPYEQSEEIDEVV